MILPLAVAVVIAATPATTQPGASVDVGTLTPIEAAVELGHGQQFSTITSAGPIEIGDRVRTDATGFAEIAYHDGSLTRLDVNTEFEVIELVDDAGESSTRTEMGIGRTWHRVESLGEGEFAVETSQATATVRGTAFEVACVSDLECAYAVLEGTIELSLTDGASIALVAPSRVDVVDVVDVVDGAVGPVEPVPFDDAFADAWVADNAARDVAAGFADPGAMFLDHGPAFASIGGSFETTGTVTDVTCDGECMPGSLAAGDTIEFTLSLEPATLVGGTYEWTVAGAAQPCGWDDDGDGVIDRETGTLSGSDTYSVTPTAAELRDGVPTVTALSGTLTTSWEVTDGSCFEGAFTSQRLIAAIAGSG